MAIVAQLVRASGCGPEGRGFEPHRSPQNTIIKQPPTEWSEAVEHAWVLQTERSADHLTADFSVGVGERMDVHVDVSV